MKRVFAVAFVVLFLSCDTVPRHTLTLTFNDAGDRITIAATTTLPSLKEARDRARVERLRDDLIAGRDEWSLRFANANPERDRVVFDRTNGELASVERSATIDADDLQKFFYDLQITAKVTRSDGVVELAIYPGTSNRANRQEREDFDKRLEQGVAATRRYLHAMSVLYAYLDEHPQRAKDVFDSMMRDENDPRPAVATDRELDMVKAVQEAVGGLLQVDWGDATREADLVWNPFPADFVVKTPAEPTLVEGFVREERGLVIRTKLLMEAVAELEGRWISPDLLGMAMREKGMSEADLVAALTAAKRRVDPVVGSEELTRALAEQLQPAPRYRVRFLARTRKE